MENLISQSSQNDSVTQHYDQSTKWNKELYINNSHFFNRLLVRRKEYAFKLLDKVKPGLNGSVIDVGCGPGAYLEEFRRKGFDVYGIDISQEMLNTCRARLNIDEITFQTHFKCGEIEKIPFQDSSFKVVACIGVLGLLISDEKAISEIYRILEPDGILLLAVENMMSLSNIDFVIRKKIKSFFTRTKSQNKSSQSKNTKYNGLTISSNWFPNQLGLLYKIYNPNRLNQFLNDNGFKLLGSLTVGHEFRILRRLKFFPKIIDGMEIWLEKYFWNHRVPYLSSSGQFYITAFIKKS